MKINESDKKSFSFDISILFTSKLFNHEHIPNECKFKLNKLKNILYMSH